MKRIIQKTIVALMFVCATSGAWAGVRKLGTDSEELLAFWPNFSSETLTSGTYTLTNFREATLDNGVITIDSSSGLAFSNSTDTATWSGNGRGITIMLNYSNFAPKNSDSTQSDNAVLIATSLAGLHDSAIGLFSNSSGTTKGFWYNNGDGVGWTPGANTFTETTINAADELFFEYDYARVNKGGTGVYVYKVASDGTDSEVYHATGLRSSVNVGKCVNIGCSSHGDNTWYLAKKMKVHSVAIFYRTLTEAQRKAFALTRKIDVTSTCNFADLTAFKDLGDNDANWNAGTNLCIRVPSTATDTVTLTLPAGGINTGSLLHIQVAAGKTLVLTGGTATAANIIVEGAGTLSVSSATALAGTIKGGGTVAYTGCLPSGVIFTNDAWTGTVWLKNKSDLASFDPGSYGNSGSTVRLTGMKGYFPNSSPTCSPAVELIDDGSTAAFEQNDAYVQTYTFRVVKGDGTFKTSGSQSSAHNIVIQDASGFTGAFTVGRRTVAIGVAPASWPGVANGSIYVAPGANATIATGKTWTAGNAISVAGTLTFAGTGKASGPLTTVNSSTLDLSGFTGTAPAISGALTLASGTTIKLPAGATLPYQIATSGNGGLINNVTVQIGNEEAIRGTVALSGGTITEPTPVNIDTDKTYTVSDVFGTPSATRSYEINVTSDATLTVPETAVGTILYNFTVANNTITLSGGYKIPAAVQYLKITDASALTAGNYTLFQWTTPQQNISGYGRFASVDTAGLNASLTAEVVYGAKAIYLRVYNKTEFDARPVFKVWAYGDSITEGWNSSSTRANYRVLLAQKLAMLGYNVEMVGCFGQIQLGNVSSSQKGSALDPSGEEAPGKWQWHSAKHGATLGITSVTSYQRAALIENVDTLCAQVDTPDVVLLHGGINDLSVDGVTEQATFDNWSNTVWRILTDLPNTKVVVSTALFAKEGQANYNRVTPKVPVFNNLIKQQLGLVEGFTPERPFPAGRVVLADLNTCVHSADTGILTSDNLHPDWWGHDQMAEGWLEKIEELYPDVNGTFPSSTTKTAPTSEELGAANKRELDSYLAGFTLCRTITAVDNINTSNPYTSVGEGVTANIGKVGYFVEYVRKDNNATHWVWVDMDAFGDKDLASIGLPTANRQQVVTSLHVMSSHNAIDTVAADDDSVDGWIEFSNKNYTQGASGVSGAPTAHGGNDKSMYDWNDTLENNGTHSCMQVFRKDPPNGRPAQTLFAYNNWQSSSSSAEFGIGNCAQHFWGGAQTLDYTFTTDLTKLNGSAYSVKTIEIWTKPVYTATIDADADFSDVAESASLPEEASSCDLVINVTANATLTFGAAKSVGTITFNIAENKTLTLDGVTNLTVGKVILSGPGKLLIDQNITLPALNADDGAVIEFANGTKLTVSGALVVLPGSTLTLEPSAISTSSSTIISAASISGSVSLTLPEEAGVEYSTLATDTSYKLVRTPVASFSYDGTIGSKPTGWGVPTGDSTDWKYEALSKQLRIGPNSDMKLVYETCDGNYSSSDCKKNSSFSIALYADVSKVTSSGKAVLLCLGSKTESMVVLYRQGDYVKVGNWIGSGFSGDWEASVPLAAGFHLYTATFNFEDGTIALYRDDGTGTSCTSSGTPAASITLPTGDASSRLQLGCAWDNSGNDFVKGANMALASIRGYDAVLGADNVAKLAESFPATANEVSWDVDLLQHNKLLTVYSTTLTEGHYLGGNYGTVTIPSGETVNVPALRFFNRPYYDYLTFNMAGCINITTESPKDVYNYQRYTAMRGSLLGHYHGYGTYNLTGTLNSPNAYVELAFTAEKQTFNVDSGLATVKGFFSANGQAEINLTNNGTIEVYDIPNDTAQITKNFGYGTYRVLADATETQAINFQGTASQPTTLDPNGHTLAMSAASLTGNGYIKVASSVAEGEKGSVTFAGSAAGFTGTVVIDDANKDLITFTDITAYYGNILYAVTGSSALPSYLQGFTGTLTISGGTVDATGVDLSGATVNIADNCTFTANAGNEGTLNIGTGAKAKLMVTKAVSDYDGHVPLAFGSGSIEYWLSDDSKEQLTGSDHINGKNLIPYYYVWDPTRETSGSLSLSNTDLWRIGEIPAAGKNVAIYVSGSKTVNVDITRTYGEVQIYGSGYSRLTVGGSGTLTTPRLNIGVITYIGPSLVVTDKILNDAGFALVGTHSCNAEIIGSAPVYVGDGLTSGTVTFSKTNRLMSGGLTVMKNAVAKSSASAVDAGESGTGFGPQNGAITVYTGGQLDLGNTQNVSYGIVIEDGLGATEVPAIVNSVADLGNSTRQTSSLTVKANAIISCEHNWGLWASDYGETPLYIKKGCTLTKTGSGDFWLTSTKFYNTGTAESAPKVVVAEGQVVVNGNGSACGLADGAKLDITVQDGASLVVSKNLTASDVEVQDGGNISVSGAALTADSLEVSGDATIDVNSTGSLSLTTVSGAGTVKWTGKQPDGTLWKSSASWTGTNVVMSAETTAITNLTPENWGRNGSYIVMKNLKGYIDTNGDTVQAKVIFENGDNGYALALSDGYGGRRSYFREIAGNGTIKDVGEKNDGDGGGAQLFIFKTATEFTGSIINLGTPGKNFTKIFVFSSAKTDSDGGTFGRIIVESDGSAVIGDGNVWNTQYGTVINGSVTLKGDATMAKAVTLNDGATLTFNDLSSDKKLTLSSTLAFASGTVNVAFGEGITTSSFYDGQTLISWSAAPAGNFAFDSSVASLSDNWVLFKEASGLKVYNAHISDEAATPANAGTVSMESDGSLKATVEPTGAAVTLPERITKLEVSVTGNAFGTLTAPGVTTGNVVVKSGSTDTTGAYTITKDGNVISFALNPNGAVGGVNVRPEVKTDESAVPMSMGASAATFTVKAIPGLWYAVKVCSTPGGTFTGANAKQADGTSAELDAPNFSGTVQYYKIVAGATEAEAEE